jgi:hypothetical protein
MNIVAHHHYAARAPMKPATDPTERSIWPATIDQQHAERHDDDIAVLQDQVGQV